MMQLDMFDHYLDSYERRAPSWVQRVQTTGNSVPGLGKKTQAHLERVTSQNYLKIYNALKEEAEFRNVEMPACYVDHSGYTRLGRACREDYTIIVEETSNRVFNEREMRALIAHELKHLYQPDYELPKESVIAEYDSDRAAIDSTDYDTVRSYVDKAIHMMIDETVPLPIFRSMAHKIHSAFPGVIAENFMIKLDKWHPSPADRMKAMRDREAEKTHQGYSR